MYKLDGAMLFRKRLAENAAVSSSVGVFDLALLALALSRCFTQQHSPPHSPSFSKTLFSWRWACLAGGHCSVLFFRRSERRFIFTCDVMVPVEMDCARVVRMGKTGGARLAGQ